MSKNVERARLDELDREPLRKGQRPPAVRQIGKGTGDGFGMLSWRKQHAGEVVACVDCGADTPRLSYRTKRDAEGGLRRWRNYALDEPNLSRHTKGDTKKTGFNPNANKTPVVTILQRDGTVRSMNAEIVTAEKLRPMVDQMIDKNNAHIMTDSATRLKFSKYGWKHSTVNHKRKEYSRHEDGLVITTNTVEGYFSIFKRGVNGVFHHVGKQYLDQYLREFDFRYNMRKVADADRVTMAVKKTSGKRLMLREPKGNKVSDGVID